MTTNRSDPSPPLVLVFAASDPTGGAGIQADIMTISSMGCHPLTVITGLTVQDTVGVEEVLPVDADFVIEQARTVLEDMPVQAFKLGVLGSVENIEVIAEIISDYPHIPVIVDPIVASGRGDELASELMLATLREFIIPQATLITPNTMEARRLVASYGDDGEERSMADCATMLLELGTEYVLITGSHANTPQVVNTLYGAKGVLRADPWERLPGSYHGSGCTLASAAAAALAHGLDMSNAVFEAQGFTWQTLSAAFRPGMGQYIPDRFFWAGPPDRGGG
ncbi:hydroxymethylpyrimidine/phosphomethylpyrimidine kinase [uncultured Zoogloea sp.]|uniref:bifunctional hydroxymethylpyrimidine kinase/phosphomethylpyrimidine kinase n=1 Tax=uncultured Zoogloea sp. TaxID=160237 RepID=UPI00260E9780|nr:hydroxymethylpyrimidine/phosphomethylpyrimidine kinase [uncultured Zoogloea sp.]